MRRSTREGRDRALAHEYVRRTALGLDPHPKLAHLSTAALEAVAVTRGAEFVRTAYFAPRDDRRDPYVGPTLPPVVGAHARRTCLVVAASAFARASDGRVRLHHQVYGSYNALCRTEPFWDQPAVLERRDESYGGFGYTAYLLDAETLLTCWHGWEHMADEAQHAVFDYAIGAPARTSDEPTSLPAERVYAIHPYPLGMPARTSDSAPIVGDWVVLRLERPVTHLGPLAPTRFARPRRGRAVYALGHPRGLPLKLTDSARVLATDGATFRTDLDTYVGNSGSPVFDATTHSLVGLVVEGQKDEGDFEAVPALGCYVSNRIDSKLAGQSSVTADSFGPAVTALLATRRTP